MLESLAFQAFLMGLISACSLPLGTLTAAVWRPRNRALAVLMAFGGGALLAALTIDLVGSALDQGHFGVLALGCMVGGLLFRGLNYLINEQGGFLRKASTTIYYLRRQQQRRLERVLAHLGRIDVFHNLPPEDARLLAAAMVSREYGPGAMLYQQHDPSAQLYIIEQGEVELLDPHDNMRAFRTLNRHDAFGSMAFFTGAPHATVARTAAETRLWVLPRAAFDDLLTTSPPLADAMQTFVRSARTATYLTSRHGLAPEQAQAWIENTLQSLRTTGGMPTAVAVERHEQEFTGALSSVCRVPIFRHLPPQEAQKLASRVFFRQYERGQTFFHAHDPADRMYIIEHGEVELIDPRSPQRPRTTLRDHDAFGAMSFLTGARHSVTAVAMADTAVWVLRKGDFDQLLATSRPLAQAVQQFLRDEDIATYLEQRQDLDADKAARWIRQAVRSMDLGRLLPSAAEMTEAVKQHHGAPLAIWLGILLDGIPEALVIGSSLLHAKVSASLIAGLFLSNYPEALSSSVGMRQQGLSFTRVLAMWTSLMLLTGVLAALGNIFFVEAPPVLFSLFKGVAAGAMLTMIAETMLPEAYFKGGTIIGFTTLLGFLAAIFFTTLD